MTPSHDTQTDIKAFERERQRALVAADLTALDLLLADDLIHIHSTGMVHNKQELLNHVKRMAGFVSIERGDIDIRVEGDLAIVTGNTVNTVRSLETGERRSLDGFSTLILRRENDGWKIILSQLTPNR